MTTHKHTCSKFLLLVAVLAYPLNGIAQSGDYFFRPSTLVVTAGGQAMKTPFAGGLNSPQLLEIDLDMDDTLDLLVYDRTSAKSLVYIYTGHEYIHRPEYELLLPPLHQWVAAEDYDCDGKKDLFTMSKTTTFVSLYKNNSLLHSLRWTLVSEGLQSCSKDCNIFGKQNIQVGATDYPSVRDLDGDGDIDIVCYNALSGGGLEYHKNLSIETYGVCDSLSAYEKVTSCWGKFVVGYDCDDLFTLRQGCQGFGGTQDRIMHNGSTVYLEDVNSDGVMDALMGDVGCSKMYVLTGTGSSTNHTIGGYFGLTFAGIAPESIIHPGYYFVDESKSGNRNLFASPTLINPKSSHADLTQSVYKLTKSSIFPFYAYASKGFLQEDMIDVGGAAYPALGDIDGDGDIDMLLGNNGGYQGSNAAQLFYFQNQGTHTAPGFSLVDTDFAQLNLQDFGYAIPYLYPLDGDNRADLLLLAKENSSGNVVCKAMINNGNNLSPFDYGQSYDFSFLFAEGDKMSLYDTDKDGNPELYVALANQQGIDVYTNTGTHLQTQFTQINDAFLGYDYLNDVERSKLSLAIGNIQYKDTLEAVVLNNKGELKIYSRINAYSGHRSPDSLIVVNTSTGFGYVSQLGLGSTLSMADLDGNGSQDLVIGTQGGGVLYLQNMYNKTIASPIIPVPKDSLPVDVDSNIIQPKPTPNPIHGSNDNKELAPTSYPNPATNVWYIESDEPVVSVEMYDLHGRRSLLNEPNSKGPISIAVAHLNDGLYIVKFHTSSGLWIRKLWVKH